MTNQKRSRNEITIEQLNLACRHVEELMAEGVTENLAIRILELFTDVYAKLQTGGPATPHHVSHVKLWSIEAIRVRQAIPDAKPRDHFVVEHGTPIRAFARMTMDLYRKRGLNKNTMNKLVESRWKLAVITIEENQRLNRVARKKVFESPEQRWAAVEIRFPTSS